MSTDVLSRNRTGAEAPTSQDRGNPQDAARGRWRKRGLLATGVIIIVASAAALIPDANSSVAIGPEMTHTITRGELVVTVTEQGTLESSDNTEVKCKVRGQSTVIWVIDGGTEVQPGDELVRLDTLALEDAIAERTKFAHLTRSGAERARADVARATLAIPQYQEGMYSANLMTLEKDLAIAKSDLLTAQNMLDHDKMMAERGYVSKLRIEERTFEVTRAELNVQVKETEIKVLKEYTQKMNLQTLEGDLNAAKANLAAEEERSNMDAERRDLAIEELEYCIIRAERSGLVIHPSAAQWRNAPEIEEGATVHKDQVLLLMPDLSQMQVKVGIHESIVERVQPGLTARITLPDKAFEGVVSSVAAVTRPAGWWTGNVVKYDTIIELPSVPGLKPGMSAEVEIVIARHKNVLTIPVKAVVETAEGEFCWVKTAGGPKRRSLVLGDTNDSFIVVDAGLKEGDVVVLTPQNFIEEAQSEALKPPKETEPRGRDSIQTEPDSIQPIHQETVGVD